MEQLAHETAPRTSDAAPTSAEQTTRVTMNRLGLSVLAELAKKVVSLHEELGSLAACVDDEDACRSSVCDLLGVANGLDLDVKELQECVAGEAATANDGLRGEPLEIRSCIDDLLAILQAVAPMSGPESGATWRAGGRMDEALKIAGHAGLMLRGLDKELRGASGQDTGRKALVRRIKDSEHEVLTRASALYQAVRALECHIRPGDFGASEVEKIVAQAADDFSELVVECGAIRGHAREVDGCGEVAVPS